MIESTSTYHQPIMHTLPKATNAIGTRLIDANLLLHREIQIKSTSGKAVVQAIVDGVSNPVEAVNRATYSARHLDIPERQKTYQRLIEAVTVLPDLSSYVRDVLGALLNNVKHYDRHCVVYRQWMYELLRKITITYADERTLNGVEMIALLKTQAFREHFEQLMEWAKNAWKPKKLSPPIAI